jgi:YHS domain-containing protein
MEALTMKNFIFMTTALIFLIPGLVFAAQKELKPQTNCPVMGIKIDKNVYLDYQGQRVYFCCPSCKEKFQKDPEKYFKKIQDDGVLLKSVQKKCPVMGGDIDKKVYTDYKGRRVYFCCASCKKTFTEDPEKYLKKME